MKLLIVTQVVDHTHPVLGFFHRWIEEFAKSCEQVTVICLQEGEHDLPENVTVLSLGKENSVSKVRQLLQFYTYVWSKRADYDSVFVHMNQLYVILGGVIWRLTGKKIGLWYTHGTVSASLRIATLLTDKIFTASSESFKLASKKKIITGHGIDTQVFKPETVPKTTDLITIGRITEAKNLHTLVAVVAEINKETPVQLRIIGVPVTSADREYEERIRAQIKSLNLQNNVHLAGAILHKDLPQELNSAKIFVTAATNGSLDKVMLEAMACGLPIVSMAEGSESLPLKENQVGSQEEMCQVILKVLVSGNYQLNEHVTHVTNEHSLKRLIHNIHDIYVR